MTQEEQRLFSGALELECTGDLDFAVHVANSLDRYEIFPKIKTDEDLGRFLVDTAFMTGKFSFPDEARPYLLLCHTVDSVVQGVQLLNVSPALQIGVLDIRIEVGDGAVHTADADFRRLILKACDQARFLVDTAFMTGKFSFPDEARPYLDYSKIGAEQRDALGGIYTPHGLVKRREEAPVQEETPKAMLLTLTASEQSYPLVLPASEKQLGQAKESLRIEDFAQAVIASAEYTAPYLNRLIPMDSITVEDANEMALCLQRLKKDGEIIKYCAALEVEEPSTFTEALDMAIDIDDYELISDSEREYGRQALRRMGANDEVLEAIEGCTDFDRLGSEMMDEDGVRQTGFGLVRRLSKPFPPDQLLLGGGEDKGITLF